MKKRLCLFLISLLFVIQFPFSLVQASDLSPLDIDEITYCNIVFMDGTFDDGRRRVLADIAMKPDMYSEYHDALESLIVNKTVYFDCDYVNLNHTAWSFNDEECQCVVYVEWNSTHLLNVNQAMLNEGFAEISDQENDFSPNDWKMYNENPFSNIGEKIKGLYLDDFGLELENVTYKHIAYFDYRTNDSTRYSISAAWIGDTLYEIRYYYNDTYSTKSARWYLKPCGNISVLFVAIDCCNVANVYSSYESLMDYVGSINDVWRKYSESLGLSKPILSYDVTSTIFTTDYTNNYLEKMSWNDRFDLVENKTGFKPRDYDVTVFAVYDANPREAPGGATAYPNSRIIWDPIREASKSFYTIFYHEMSHLYGWAHDWSYSQTRPIESTDFRTILGEWASISMNSPPAFFGWEDVDGDGVVEILDETPYGVTVEIESVDNQDQIESTDSEDQSQDTEPNESSNSQQSDDSVYTIEYVFSKIPPIMLYAILTLLIVVICAVVILQIQKRKEKNKTAT